MKELTPEQVLKGIEGLKAKRDRLNERLNKPHVIPTKRYFRLFRAIEHGIITLEDRGRRLARQRTEK